MDPKLKEFITKVQSFYTDTLIYYPEYQPKPDDINQVYFPYTQHSLDVDGLTNWLTSIEITPTILEWLDLTLFNKDKHIIQTLSTLT
jgi:hypothetical protein